MVSTTSNPRTSKSPRRPDLADLDHDRRAEALALLAQVLTVDLVCVDAHAGGRDQLDCPGDDLLQAGLIVKIVDDNCEPAEALLEPHPARLPVAWALVIQHVAHAGFLELIDLESDGRYDPMLRRALREMRRTLDVLACDAESLVELADEVLPSGSTDERGEA
ncbi:MAG: hypothetical protein AAGD32_13645 [Planctomycetota bacterium]